MANDTNVFKNSVTAAGYVTPEEWSSAIEQVARENNYFRNMQPSINVVDAVGQPGNTMHIQKNVALSAAAVTDGDSVGISALSFSQIDVTAGIVGVSTQITLKQLRDQLTTVREDVIRNLGMAIAEKEENDIITELLTTSTTALYDGAVTEDTIDSDDNFTVGLLNKGIVAMRTSKRKPQNLVIHPVQEGDLRALQQFTDASYLGSARVNETGFIGTFFGINVYSSSNVATTAEGTSDDVTVYNAILLGERALVLMDKKRPTIEMDRGSINDLSMTFLAYSDYGVQILNDESIIVLRSA